MTKRPKRLPRRLAVTITTLRRKRLRQTRASCKVVTARMPIGVAIQPKGSGKRVIRLADKRIKNPLVSCLKTTRRYKDRLDIWAKRAGLTDEEYEIALRPGVMRIAELHREIDRLTFAAYGWSPLISDEEVLRRLVALNKERVEEEARGHVRWLRPDYQIPLYGQNAGERARPETIEHQADLFGVEPEDPGKPLYPSKPTERAKAIGEILTAALSPLTASEIAGRFRQGRKIETDIAGYLRSFSSLGQAFSSDGKAYGMRGVA